MRILLELSSWHTLCLGLEKSSMMYTSASLTGEAPQTSNKLQPVLNHDDISVMYVGAILMTFQKTFPCSLVHLIM